MEWFIAFMMIAPALGLAFRRSTWVLDYAILVLAFNRGIRRIVDYFINGQFNPFSPISLTPLIVAGVLLVPALFHWHHLPRRVRLPFIFLGIAVLLGFAVGLVLNRSAAIYSLTEWMAAIGAMAFAATQPASAREADRWIKTAGWAAVGVAGYGWWQYYTIPPWDGMWLVQSGMAGYMGQPEPTKMTVFSTLNERGPCGTFLAWAAIPMILSPRWRNPGRWVSVALLLSVIALTQTRTNFIIIALVAILYPALSKGRGAGRLLIFSGIVVLAATWGVERIPGMQTMTERFGGEAFYGEGSSINGRITIYQEGLSLVLRAPLGLGLGSSGMAKRTAVENSGSLMDAGYIQILAQFGWVGGLFFFVALWKLWQELGRRWSTGARLLGPDRVDPFISATRAILITSLIFLFVTDIFAGFSLIWVFFGRALNRQTDPKFIAGRLSLRQHRSQIGQTNPALPTAA